MESTSTRMTAGQAWALGLASAGAFMIQMDIQVVATALVTIHRDLHASLESLEWTIDAYLLTFAALMLTAAGLGDRIGRRRTFIAGLGVFVVGSVACALAPNAGVLIAARALQGVGAAVVMPLSLTILSAAFPARTRGRALGLYAGLGGVATGVGPLLGGVIAENLSWQWVFWVNVPIGMLTMVLVALRIDESRGPTKRLDPVGVALVSVGTLALVWGLARSNTSGWGSHWIVSTLVAGAVLLTAFAIWELRAPAPILPMPFFRFRAFTAGNAVNASLFAVMYGILFLVAQYFQQGLGYGPTEAGLRLMPLTGTLMLIAPLAGHLADHGGERRVAAGGLALLVIGLVGLAVSVRLAPGYPAMVAPLVLLGVGASACIPAAQKAVVGAVAPEEIGRASGAFSMLRILSGALGLAVAGAVFAAAGGHESAAGFAAGLVPGIVVTAAIGALGFAASLGIPRQAIP